tara:strand:- start:31227 stop:32540 length:1314 start_codon:yes stop_codon:yes gene_type:complete
MFLKDKITKGALKLDTSIVQEEDNGKGIKPVKGINVVLKAMESKSYIEFDGTDSVLEGGPDDMKFGTGDFTISSWIYMSSASTMNVAGKYADSGNYWYYDLWFSSDVPVFNFGSRIGNTGNAGGSFVALGADRSSLGYGWMHVVLTQDRDSGFTAWINGIQQNATVAGNTAAAGNLDVAGLYSSGYSVASTVRTANGVRLAEQRWYDRVLTSAEIRDLYKTSFTEGANAGGLIDNLKDQYNFGDRWDRRKGNEFNRVSKDDTQKQGFLTRPVMQQTTNSLFSSVSLVGTELVTNGTFDSDLSGWTVSGSEWEQSSGKAICDEHLKDITLSGETTNAGYIYDITYTASRIEGSACYVQPYIGTRTGTMEVSFPVTKTETLRAKETGGVIKFRAIKLAADNTIAIDNISILEYPVQGIIPVNFAASAFARTRLKGGKLV